VVRFSVITAMKARQIDVLIIDPFVKVHRVSENDNSIMDAVVTVFAEIAEATNGSVELVQHARKTGGAEIGVDDARGASSVVARHFG
jgi:RecA-family ATPase